MNLVRRIGSQALTTHYLVDMLPQSDLPSREKLFVASGRQLITLVRVTNLEPGDILGVVHAPLMCVPLDALQHDGQTSGTSSGLHVVTPISTVTTSPLAATATTASPSPVLLERLTPEKRASFLTSGNDRRRICARLRSTFTARTEPL